MKRTFLALALAFSVLTIHAQQQLLRSEVLPFGSTMTHKSVLNFSVIDTTIQGANAVWNFGSLKVDPDIGDLIEKVVDPKSTPYADKFKNSNYAYKETLDGETGYSYFNLTNTKLERVGSYFDEENTYSDPQIEEVFPLGLGTVSNDPWASTNSTFGGDYNLKCIGTGKLTIPGGTYNAILVRVFLYELIEEYVYYWYDSDNGAILLFYKPGDGFWSDEEARYMSSLTNGIDDMEILTSLQYNNPVKNDFVLNFKSNNGIVHSYVLTNALGQEVNSGQAAMSGNNETVNLDFSSYDPGIYFLSLKSEGSKVPAKTIKIVKE